MSVKSCFSLSSVDGSFEISGFGVAGKVHVCVLLHVWVKVTWYHSLGLHTFVLLRKNLSLGLYLTVKACLAGHWALEFCPFPSPQHRDFMWEWNSGLFACTLSTLLIKLSSKSIFPDFVTTELYWQAAWQMSTEKAWLLMKWQPPESSASLI